MKYIIRYCSITLTCFSALFLLGCTPGFSAEVIDETLKTSYC